MKVRFGFGLSDYRTSKSWLQVNERAAVSEAWFVFLVTSNRFFGIIIKGNPAFSQSSG